MPNLDLVHKDDLSSFRKIAIGTWQTAYDPSVYGTMELRMDKAMDYIAQYRAATGKRLTVTHLLAKATAMCFQRCPDANAVIRFNRIYLRKIIGVFMQVVMTDEGADKIDLSGATIYEVEKLSLTEIVEQVEAKVDKVRKRQDPALEGTRSSFKKMPHFILNAFLKALAFFSFELNLDLRWAGVPKDPFGSVMITNIGSIGLNQAYVPLVPYSHVPILLATGNVVEQPVVEDGKIVVGKVMKINATFDHRIIDGFHASIMSKTLKEFLENPFEKFDPIPSGAAKAANAG
ncbi:MAG: 2-oxo acid dehydrogenase subunit E2 [Deltaproteobacteria bacterium]|nr:2-oxo acid dehydrogenase subunit E2 [Deltaproteobacteria bacterium]